MSISSCNIQVCSSITWWRSVLWLGFVLWLSGALMVQLLMLTIQMLSGPNVSQVHQDTIVEFAQTDFTKSAVITCV